MYFVNFGPDVSHISFESKTFKRKKDAVEFYNNLPNVTKQVSDRYEIFIMTVDGKRLCHHAIDCMGQEFNGDTRKEVFDKVKSYLEEWELVFLEFEGFKYYSQITGNQYASTVSTMITLNRSLRKKHQAGTKVLDKHIKSIDRIIF